MPTIPRHSAPPPPVAQRRAARGPGRGGRGATDHLGLDLVRVRLYRGLGGGNQVPGGEGQGAGVNL